MTRKKKIALATSLIGAVGAVALVSYSVFSSGTENNAKHGSGGNQNQTLVLAQPPAPILIAKNNLLVAQDIVSDRLILRFASDSEMLGLMRSMDGYSLVEDELNAAIKHLGATVEFKSALNDFGENIFLFRIEGDHLNRESMNNVIMAISQIDGVLSSEEDVIVSPTSVQANDPYLPQQWAIGASTGPSVGIGAQIAWNNANLTNRPVIAILDTGVTEHADLAANLIPGYNFISDPLRAGNSTGRSPDGTDLGDWIDQNDQANPAFSGCPARASSWHGTHVAGIAAAASDNGQGIAGVSPKARIQPVRVLGKCGGYITDVAAGVLWAAGLPVAGVATNQTPAKVINMSLSATSSCPSVMSSAIAKASAAGSIVVAAAGNSNQNAQTAAPANCSGVISVAATDSSGDRASYSNYGAVSISAPGGSTTGAGLILSTINSGTTQPASDAYAGYQGTSMAAPHVSGLAALIIATKPSISAANVKSALIKSATPFAENTGCATAHNCGAGIVNAENALAESANSGVNLFADKVRGEPYFVPGLESNLKLTIGNSGSSEFSGQLPIQVYLSDTEVLDFNRNPLLVGEVTPTVKLAPTRGVVTVTIPVKIGASVANGPYFLVARTNPNAAPESEKSFLDNDIHHGPIEVVRPEFDITIKRSTDQTPSAFRAQVTPKDSRMANLTRRWSYNWSVPEGVEAKKIAGSLFQGVVSQDGTRPLSVTIAAPNNVFSQNAASYLDTRAPDPLEVSFRIRQSNKFGRAPLTVLVTPTVTGGHPENRIVSSTLSTGSGETLQETTRSRGAFVDLPAGDHLITYSIKTKHGIEMTHSETITVIPNLKPSCGIVTKRGSDSFTFVANCTDEDGKIKNYEWKVNGNKRLASSNRIFVPFDIAVNGQIEVELTGTDDSGDTSVATEVITGL